MNRKATPSASAAALRRRAEARLRHEPRPPGSKARGTESAANAWRLLHELQVHRVELEMQNAELQEARNRMESLVEKYADLYDFAPVGYFSLDERSRILEVNLTGAAMLGVERSRLIHRRLLHFVAPADQSVMVAFLDHIFAGPGKQVCEAPLVREGGGSFWANFHAASAVSLSAPHKWCRVAVSDISSFKQAQEAQHRMKALALTNQELNREIARRQAVEEALKQSQQQQSRLLEQSRHMQEQLRHLSRQVLQAQEEERKRISRELHDEIAQMLVGINVQLEALARQATVEPKDLKRRITRTQRLVGKSVNIVHEFARELRPTALDDLGLVATLHSLMQDFMKRTGIRVQFTTFAGVERLASARRTVVYRVVQHALANVAQHAHASRVEVNIRRLGDALRMDITDNGKAFAVKRVSHAKTNQRLGLLGMRERVEMVGGTFSVTSAPGRGTTIRAQIPFTDAPARNA